MTTKVNARHSVHPAAPRLLVAGLIVFAAACHRQPTATTPAPAPERRPAPPAATVIRDGPSLVRAMREKYPNWYRTFTFEQKTTLSIGNGGSLVQTWFEAGALPGRLRIDTDTAQKSGTLFARDTIYSFANGRRAAAAAGLNYLLVLGFDAYVQSPARTEAQLRARGFDLTRFHETTWRGQPVYVVGALAGDTASRQFWVAKDNLLFVRMIEPGARGRTDVRFENYVPAGRGWMATRVEQYVGGTRRVLEEYTDVHTDVSLPDGIFDPAQWAANATWMRSRATKD